MGLMLRAMATVDKKCQNLLKRVSFIELNKTSDSIAV